MSDDSEQSQDPAEDTSVEDEPELEEDPDTADPAEEGDEAGDDEPNDEADAAGEEEPAAEEDEGIAESDIVRLAYTARSAESDTLVDTTDPEIADEEGVDTEERTIEPRVIPLGAGHLFPSVETDIVGSEVGDTGTVEVSPAEAFGEYEPDNVRTVSADTIPEDDRYPGAQVEIDGEHGYVETIIGGRARVDFNHPLAGESITWEYEILEIIEDRLEQAKGILGGVVDADLDVWVETEEEEQPVDAEEGDETEIVEVETLFIESVPQLALNQQWLFRKRQIAQELIDRLGVDRVIVQETIEGTGGMGDVEAALEGVDVDADEIAEELEEEGIEDEALESSPD